MANQEQLEILKQGVDVWNIWREEHPEIRIELQKVDLRKANLIAANFEKADLSQCRMNHAMLRGANLKNAELYKADFAKANLNHCQLDKAILYQASFVDASLCNASLFGLKTSEANFMRASLLDADLSESNLKNSDFFNANLCGAKLHNAELTRADFTRTDLSYADFTQATLIGANLFSANCNKTTFAKANLTGVNLQNAIFVDTELEQTVLNMCRIYGLSAWGLKGTPKSQESLVITPDGEAAIKVDDLQVAQFVYLLLNNKAIRNVIGTITSKAVLILGRFTPDRWKVLDQLRQELGRHDYVPILFDFRNTEHQSLMETIMTLTGLARFVIADVTAATMVREELRSIVEKYPSKPIQPILLQGEDAYVTLPEMLQGFKSILPIYVYKDSNDVISSLATGIIEPAEKWIEDRQFQIVNGGKTQREVELERQLEEAQRLLAEHQRNSR